MSYDQWKTASPYDNEPDYIEVAAKLGNKCREAALNLDDYRVSELRELLDESSATLIEIANYMEGL